jgi:galactose mutarotase-like enzyme
MSDPDPVQIHAPGGLSATIAAEGAELVRLTAPDGSELLWDGGAAWARHAPVLFPIVGRLAGDTLRHNGRSTRLTQHGFARDRRFTPIERAADRCTFRLTDDEASRAIYPFAFALDIAYAVDGLTLSVSMTAINPEAAGSDLLASLGAHPAFVWPLVPGTPKTDHRLVFEHPEPAPVRRVAGGLLTPTAHPSPIEGAILPLDEALFDDDALILPGPASHSVRYEGGGRALVFAWRGADTLGLWSKRGGDFLCIEPWRGHASPEGFDGEFRDKPGVVAIPPGGRLELGWQVSLVA